MKAVTAQTLVDLAGTVNNPETAPVVVLVNGSAVAVTAASVNGDGAIQLTAASGDHS